MPPLHTKEVLSDVLLDWNTDRKLSTITMDNCLSNDGMIDILLEKFSSSGSLLLSGKIFHMRCATCLELDCKGRSRCHRSRN